MAIKKHTHSNKLGVGIHCTPTYTLNGIYVCVHIINLEAKANIIKNKQNNDNNKIIMMMIMYV